jgi:hypothetical protein
MLIEKQFLDAVGKEREEVVREACEGFEDGL